MPRAEQIPRGGPKVRGSTDGELASNREVCGGRLSRHRNKTSGSVVIKVAANVSDTNMYAVPIGVAIEPVTLRSNQIEAR
jgi:hypothetical protein